MILPLSMGDLALVRAAIRSRRAVSHPPSDTVAGFPNSLPRRGAAGGNPVTPVTGSNPFNERACDSEADSLVGGAQCVRVHSGGDTL